MSFNQLIKRQSVTGLRRIIKATKNLESNQAHPVMSVEATVSSPPTTGEINSAFDTASNVGQDFVGLIIDTVNSNEWLVWTDGTSWYVISQADSSLGIGARVYNNANISIPNNLTTEVTFNSERFDTSDFHSTTVNTGRFTIPTDGIYFLSASVSFSPGGAGGRSVSIENLSRPIAAQTIDVGLNVQTVLTVSTQWQFSENDQVRMLVSQTSGGPLNITSSQNYSPEFSICKIG